MMMNVQTFVYREKNNTPHTACQAWSEAEPPVWTASRKGVTVFEGSLGRAGNCGKKQESSNGSPVG